ncbi:MAG: hypothetical protein LBF27_07080 [Sphingobacterium sp.]|jgi:hypothetical protein|nr:hypothetical protein [Sphingobacterium sp.]
MNRYGFLLISFMWLNFACGQITYRYKDVETISANYIQKDIKISNAIEVEEFLPKNYVKDGSVDYTNFVQKALNRGGKILFPGFPILINDQGLILKSNSDIYFSKNSKLSMKPSSLGTYRILKIYNSSNINITNLNLIGDRKVHKGKGGEWGIGIDIRNSKDIAIQNTIIKDFWGDGICLGAGIPNQRILIKNVFIDNCRRNGITVGSAIDSKISNVTISNISGAAPMAGIDIEPNNNKDVINNIVIENYNSFNNKSRGLLIDLRNFKGEKKRNINISVTNFKDDGSYYGLSMPLLGKFKNQVEGNINLEKISLRNNGHSPIQSYDVVDNKLKVSIRDHNVNQNNLGEVVRRLNNQKK